MIGALVAALLLPGFARAGALAELSSAGGQNGKAFVARTPEFGAAIAALDGGREVPAEASQLLHWDDFAEDVGIRTLVLARIQGRAVRLAVSDVARHNPILPARSAGGELTPRPYVHTIEYAYAEIGADDGSFVLKEAVETVLSPAGKTAPHDLDCGKPLAAQIRLRCSWDKSDVSDFAHRVASVCERQRDRANAILAGMGFARVRANPSIRVQ